MVKVILRSNPQTKTRTCLKKAFINGNCFSDTLSCTLRKTPKIHLSVVLFLFVIKLFKQRLFYKQLFYRLLFHTKQFAIEHINRFTAKCQYFFPFHMTKAIFGHA